MAERSSQPVAPATADQSGVTGASAVSPIAQPGAQHVTTGRFRRRYSLLTGRDKLVLGLMVGIPLALDLIFIWGPTIVSFFLSFTNWNGIGSPFDAKVIGITNYQNLFTAYPFFWPALAHNLIWLAWLMFIATPIGILFAVLLDRVGRGTRFYQTVFYLPVVLSLAVIGIIWKLQYAPEQGFINNVLGRTANNNLIDWLGDPSLNLWAALVATSWRHVGYIMVLYLAGLKAFDPTLREAAKVDGANERQTFFRVVFPVMMPINVVIVVITTIEALRAFDIAYIINRGKNGLELLSTLITNNAISESNRLGFGSAIAVVLLVISLGPIVAFLTRMMRDQGQR
ncbi:MAG TPA: sugar ABC transporter permease [Candidatus Limnocylindrales bacterium]